MLRYGEKLKLSLYLTMHRSMKAYGGVDLTAPGILNLVTRWRWAVSFTVRPLYPRYPLVMRLGVPQSPPGQSDDKEKYTCPFR